MRRHTILVPICVSLAGCWVYLSPTTYRCSDIAALYEYRKYPPGGWLAKTKDEVLSAYKRFGSDLVLNDKDPNVWYFSYGQCPIWRYRFEKDHLVARGYLVMEMGTWNYIDIK